MKATASLLLLLVASGLASCGRFEGAFHFLREPPKEEAIPGRFVIEKVAYSEKMLRDMGYADTSVTIVLNKDRTFEITRMPDCWLTPFADSKGGYDGCRGTWTVEKIQSVYAVSLSVADWAADSTFVQEKKDPRFGYSGAFTLTKEKDGYGLALALAAGDKGYIYFQREKSKEANPLPTPASVTPAAGAPAMPPSGAAGL